MTVGLSSRSLVLCAGTLPAATALDERIEVAATAGFDGLSLWGRDYAFARATGATDADLRARFSDNGLAVAEIDGVWDWTPGAPSMPSGIDPFLDHDERSLLEIGAALGARSINAVDVFGGDWGRDAAAEAFAGLCDRALERGLLVHLEALPFSRIPNVEEAMAVVRSADRANGGVLIDAWHLFRAYPTSAGAIAAVETLDGDRVLGVQLGDGPIEREADLMTAALRDRQLPGEGSFDVVGLVGALDAAGASSPIGIEVFSDELQSKPPMRVAEMAMESLRRTIELAVREGGRRRETARPGPASSPQPSHATENSRP